MEIIKTPNVDINRSVSSAHRILVVGVDTQVGLWIVRSLGSAGLKVFCICRSPNGLAVYSRYCMGAWLMEYSTNDTRFIDNIETLAKELNVGSIMTIAENYHLVLIQNRDRFEPDIHLFCPSEESFARATDKDYLHDLALKLKIPVARGTTLDKLMADKYRGTLKFPLVLRTRQQNDPDGKGVCPWKAAYAENEAKLEKLYQRVENITSNVIVQEYHPGVEVHIQILMHNGEAFMAGEYIGEHHMPLAGGLTVLRVTCHHEKLIQDAVRLLKAVDWEGVAAVQFHYDPKTDEYIFLEINPRYCGGLPTIIIGGFDIPFLQWQSHFEPDRMRRGRYRLGVRTRVLGGDANWLLSMIGGDPLPPEQKRLGKIAAISKFLWHFGPWTRDDVFWFKDPKPAWVDLKQMAKRLRLK